MGYSLASVSGLLHRIQEHHGPGNERYVTPGTLLRCDGGTLGNPRETAIFMAVPFLKLDKLMAARKSITDPNRPLYQALSSFEGMPERDKNQLFLKNDGRRDRRVIWVKHVWVMIVGKGTITRLGRINKRK
jgi:hypothetical protein